MDKVIDIFLNSLVTPACIIDKDLKILHTNESFLTMADVSSDYIDEDILLNQCIDIDIFKKNPELIEKIYTQEEDFQRQRIKGRNSKGKHLSLSISVVPAFLLSPSEDTLILIFTDSTEEEIIQKKYKELYEKEKDEREKIEEFNTRLNDLVDNKAKELKEAHLELEKAYSALKSELEIAKSVQAGLLPDSMPNLMNMEVSSLYIPTDAVGGDMFDIVPIKDNKTVVFIFDVSGHGVPSALICAMAKMLFVHHIKQGGRPSEIFTAVNKDICSYIRTGHYLTAFLGIIDHIDNTMIYSQAGHVYPIIYRHKTQKTTFIPGNSVFIGHVALSDIATYHDDIVTMDWNDKLLFYTDGLTEALNDKGELYSSQRLMKIVKKYGKSEPETIIKRISGDSKRFRKGIPFRDDCTMFCIQIGCSEVILKKSGFTRDDRPEVITLNSHDEIEDVCSMIMQKLDRKGYSNEDIFQAHQSVHEILSNAIQHGNKYNPDKKVSVLYKISLDNFSISVIDEGDGFDYKKLPDPFSKENMSKDHGKGLHIVKEYMDEITFNDKGNRIMIGKYQKQAV